jgi:multiple sugar transport system substrate-binding protein
MVKMFSRRDFLKTASLLAAGGVLAACAPQPTATPGAAEVKPAETKPAVAPPVAAGGKILSYWFAWGGTYAGAAWEEMQKLPEFKEIMGDTTMEIKSSVPEENLLTAIAGGTPPDCAGNVNYLDYMARGVLSPIDDLVAASKRIKKEDFYDANWQLGLWKGKLYGLPCTEGFVRYGANYNKTMVTDAGLDPTKPPETWDEWLEWHKILTKFDDAKNIKQIGLDPLDAMGESLWTTDGWLWQVSWGVDDWFDPNTGKFNINNEKLMDYFATTKKFTDIIGMDNLSGLHSVAGQGTWGGSYNTWVQAAILEGYWHPGETVNEQPEHTPPNVATWLPVPSNRKGTKVQLAGGHTIISFKDGTNKNQLGAFNLQEFCNTKAALDIIYNKVGWLPGVKAYIDTVDPSKFPGLDFYIRSAKEATEWHSPLPCPITSFVANTFVEVREKVLRDQIKPEEAGADLQKRVEDEYKAAGFSS